MGVAYVLRPADASVIAYARDNYLYAAVLIVVWCFAAADQRLFASHRSDLLVSQLFSIVRAYFATALFAGFLLALLSEHGIDRPLFLSLCLAALSVIVIVRLVMRLGLWDLRRRGYNYRRILFIGANERTAHLVSVFRAHEQYGYHIEGYLEDDPSRDRVLAPYALERLGALSDLERVLVEHVVDAVYITLPLKSNYEAIHGIASLCEGIGVPVRIVADLFPVGRSVSDVARVGRLPLFTLTGGNGDYQTRLVLRRAIELVVAGILLTLLFPWFLLIALLIKLESPGPAVVRRWCAAPGRAPFQMYAFRTRREEGGEPDGRPTRFGALLHRYGLDELPQLLNVIAGHMSLTGPRPPEVSVEKGAAAEMS